ncbi:Ankyrin repeat, partial [Globisporangium splendens]
MGSSGNTVLENYTIGDVLICKAHRGKLQEIAYLVDELHADINYTNQNGASALHGAAASGQLEVVQWMMSLPTIDRSVTDHDEQTALHYAAFYGHLEVVQFLVEHGVPLDVPDKYGGTCLHWAASKGRKEVIQYLCMKGIDVHVTSYLAKDKHKTKCVQFLKSWYETSQRFVHAAEDGDNEEIIRIVAEINGAYPLRFMRDKNGKNALHWAAEAGHLSTLKLLCEHFVVWTDADKGWEDGNNEYSNNEEDSVFMSEQNYRSNAEEDDAQGVSTSRPRNIDAVHNWLKSLKMDEYTKNFERDGFDTLRGVATIDEDDLIDMRVKKGHRRVVLSHIEELRNQLALLDENSNSAGQEPDSSPTLSMLPVITKQLSSSSLVSSSAAGGDAPAPRLERRGSLTGYY